MDSSKENLRFTITVVLFFTALFGLYIEQRLEFAHQVAKIREQFGPLVLDLTTRVAKLEQKTEDTK